MNPAVQVAQRIRGREVVVASPGVSSYAYPSDFNGVITMARRHLVARNVRLRRRFSVTVLCAVWVGFALVMGQSKKNVADPSYRKEVIEKISGLLEARYVIPEEAKAWADEIRAKNEAGAYAAVTEPAALAEKITADLRAITHDQHLWVRLVESTGSGEKAESPLSQSLHFLQLRDREHAGVFKLDWLEGRIAYLDIRRFYPPSLAKDILAGATAALVGADAVVIDLRENQGGAGEVLPFLCGAFFRQPTQLSSWYSRERDFLQEFWTRREVGGERLADVPLFLLTGPKTFSAAEMFAYDMQASRRAMIVGEATRGGAHSVDLFRVDDQFEIYISTGRAVNPLTGSNWEGVGVLPDVRVAV
ncbi:MAG: S41 family peptidase, partial [Candidatus Aminicenantes bacterium]|nr:S41 family peptidase [Candidatus Aminicenantes bacterium]